MPLWLRQSLIPTLILSAMLITLGVLAWLQYGWSVQVSDALQQRMRSGLASAVQRFQTAFQQDLARLCAVFEVDTANSEVEMKSALVDHSRTRLPADLVSRVYSVRSDARGDWQAEALDFPAGKFEPMPWPAAWSQLALDLSADADDLESASPRQWHHRPWLLEPDTLLLFRAVASESDINETLRYKLLGYVVIELDRAMFEKTFLPQLIERSFRTTGDPDYRVSIIRAEKPPTALFDSQPDDGPPQTASAEQVIDLLAPSGGLNLREAGDTPVLKLIAQHRTGSLDAAVTRLRRRNLGVSFGVLLVLCAGIAFLAITAQRAQQLARLQVDFVAGFSHELRTPVAALCMMADNMADGVVKTEPQIRQYGGLLQTQGRRLRTMVEEVLFFAAHQHKKPELDLRPVNLADVTATALAGELPLIEAAGIQVEQHISPDLPLVLADTAALRTCIGNLLNNAAKYGKQGGWIGIRAESGAEIRLTVEDHGPGIDAADRRHVFEPFYRGARAKAAQAPGAGLGLGLVRQMIEAMGGRVTVKSEEGAGSAFTLHLKAASIGSKQS